MSGDPRRVALQLGLDERVVDRLEAAGRLGDVPPELEEARRRLYAAVLAWRSRQRPTIGVRHGRSEPNTGGGGGGGGGALPASARERRRDASTDSAIAFAWWPADPSVHDHITFFQPVGSPVATTLTWVFGDGCSARGSTASHRYTSDGSYRVNMCATCRDGRVTTRSATVTVSTHDVGILRIATPERVRVRETIAITVALASTRWDERFWIDLFRIRPSGRDWIDTALPTISATTSHRPMTISFAYTVGEADAVGRSLRFQAVATLRGARDATPTDNIATSLPALVTR